MLRQPDLVEAIEALGYVKTFGNRWERPIDGRGVAAVDLLVPAYTSRARETVKVGDAVTTEVPGLAVAFRRPALTIDAELQMTDGAVATVEVVLPDAIGTLALKAGARSVRHEARDAEDLWRCLEIAAADGVTPEMFDGDTALEELRSDLWRELGPNGHSLASPTEETSRMTPPRADGPVCERSWPRRSEPPGPERPTVGSCMVEVSQCMQNVCRPLTTSRIDGYGPDTKPM